MPRYGKTARSVRQIFLFQTAELFLSEIVFPALRILFVLKFITQLFFPVSLMCMSIFVSRDFLIRRRSAPEHSQRRTAALPTWRRCPNLNPVPDCKASLEEELRRIRESACVHVHPYGAISVGQKGEQLADLDAMAPEVIAFSDDGKGVQSESLMREAMEQCRRLGKILAAHCEDNRLLRGGYIHDGAYAKTHSHRGICSESEWGQIARDVRLAEETGCAYHVCHVSTKESVSIIREAKRRGVNVTCETGPHYLTFTEDDLQEDGRFKMNPPLRSREDRDALIEGLLDGTIDMIVTDHAPHSREEKARGLEKSAMGVVGLETSFAACYTSFVKPGVLPLGKLMDLMHDAPMRRFGCGTELAIGQPADLTVFNLSESYVVEPEQFLSMGRATPFAGVTLTGVCKMTMIDGKIVWKEETL